MKKYMNIEKYKFYKCYTSFDLLSNRRHLRKNQTICNALLIWPLWSMCWFSDYTASATRQGFYLKERLISMCMLKNKHILIKKEFICKSKIKHFDTPLTMNNLKSIRVFFYQIVNENTLDLRIFLKWFVLTETPTVMCREIKYVYSTAHKIARSDFRKPVSYITNAHCHAVLRHERGDLR